MMGSNTFIKITNKDIYDRIGVMEKKNAEEHAIIMLHQQKTNGKVQLNKWISTSAMTLVFALAGGLISHRAGLF